MMANILPRVDQVLNQVNAFQAGIDANVQRLRGEIKEPTTKSPSLNAKVICLLSLKIFAFISSFGLAITILRTIQPPILSYFRPLVGANFASWVCALAVTWVAFRILTTLNGWLIKALQKKMIDSPAVKLMEEVYKARQSNPPLFEQIYKLLRSLNDLKKIKMAEDQMAQFKEKKESLIHKIIEIEQWQKDQKLEEVLGWHRLPLLWELGDPNGVRFLEKHLPLVN